MALEGPRFGARHFEDSDAFRELAFDTNRNENRELPFLGKPNATGPSADVKEKTKGVRTALVRGVLDPERLLVGLGRLSAQRGRPASQKQAEPDSARNAAPHPRRT